uniref:Protein RFT1 homolog n=1 Tax=Chromera velia CCMP2878 TaxID=1169474 RepID=A0A0G4G8F3_9ALVE|eukprot:Cvel_20761.t1-p1 / transcript=Cvel_20761.t1 / gene=Cvel_20761 / organism=Chromera_velia_CCMP2878 / gene_product=Protein RFT1 homolog, putative / transcript_product=Protein RFT1 homolog, putative / location=Cvel_scaffold1892:25255-27886(+) / protein_length=618 / sequence_SO=supercontig / SO=protein_coding / is_pseudo=false
MSSAVGRAVKGIAALVLGQFLSRVVTFSLNTVCARTVDSAVYGIGQFSLPLLNSLTLFFAKECFRRSAQRNVELSVAEKSAVSGRKKKETETETEDEVQEILVRQSAINVAWFSVGFSILVCIPLTLFWAASTDLPPNVSRWSYVVSVGVVALGTVIEACAEPFLIWCLSEGEYAFRAGAQALGLMSRAVVVFLLLIASPCPPVIAFALGGLAEGVIWTSMLSWKALKLRKEETESWGCSLFPQQLDISRDSREMKGKGKWREVIGSWMLDEHYRLNLDFLVLTCQKLILSEGEKVMMLSFFHPEDWGVFALVSNLGSAVCRMLFAPIEELGAAEFGKLPGVPEVEQRKSLLNVGTETEQGAGLLRRLLLLEGGIGAVGATLGPCFPHAAVLVLFGTRWGSTEAPRVLELYCYLLFLLALNGALEAHMFQTAPPGWLRVCQGLNMVLSTAFLYLGWLFGSFLGLRSVGLVLANCFNMFLRILLCLWYLFLRSGCRVETLLGNFVEPSVPPLVAGLFGVGLVLRLLPRALFGSREGLVASFLHSYLNAEGESGESSFVHLLLRRGLARPLLTEALVGFVSLAAVLALFLPRLLRAWKTRPQDLGAKDEVDSTERHKKKR